MFRGKEKLDTKVYKDKLARFPSGVHIIFNIKVYTNSENVTNRRLIASDSSIEGNRRDYNMSGNQTSGKEGGVRYVMMVVCMYVCIMYTCTLDIIYI